ncbi:hypothetical protein [Anaerovibrio lipolyticus]|uniref:hypothetical protein n=1 Tax=Anaerovibrio lipolyticus TaxID=82374 RepID=UPI000484F9E0|nr:hypothetical protein [Anaerovibrio lipolyticus]
MINIFIPHRWKTEDFGKINELLSKTKYDVRDYSVPEQKQLEYIDRRYNVDPQIQSKIKWSSVIVCSNRPALSGGMAIEEIKFAHSLNKPIVAVRITQYDNSELNELKVPVIPCRKDSLEAWINANL